MIPIHKSPEIAPLQRRQPAASRRGFTLIELLIVVAIVLLLAGIVAYAIQPSQSSRLREAGRIGQAAIMGARDRALHAKAKRGFRLVIDPNDSTLATGFVYLQPMDRLEYPPQSIQLERPDLNQDNDVLDAGEDAVVVVRGFDPPSPPDPPPYTDWHNMTGFFANPPRIRIPAGTGQWYTFYWNTNGPYALNASNQYLMLTSPFVDSGTAGFVAHFRTGSNSSCEIEIGNELLPHHAPISLPSGVVIDLPFSSAPAQGGSDVMFSPRGMVTGAFAALGPVHLLLRDARDAGKNPIDPTNVGEAMVLSIFPQTGHVATFPIDPTDLDNNQVADDLFRYAKQGSGAGS